MLDGVFPGQDVSMNGATTHERDESVEEELSLVFAVELFHSGSGEPGEDFASDDKELVV